MERERSPDYGALVGWTAEPRGQRLVLRLQTVTSPPPHSREDVHETFVMLDHNQAAQLGNMLFEITNRTSPEQLRRTKKPLLERLLGV